MAEAFRHDTVELTALDGGRTRVALGLDSWEWPLVALAFLDADFTIEAPEAFLQGLRRFAERLRDAAD